MPLTCLREFLNNDLVCRCCKFPGVLAGACFGGKLWCRFPASTSTSANADCTGARAANAAGSAYRASCAYAYYGGAAARAYANYAGATARAYAYYAGAASAHANYGASYANYAGSAATRASYANYAGFECHASMEANKYTCGGSTFGSSS